MRVVLASASPRRKRLLERIVPRFSAKPARISERMAAGESFPSAAVRLAEKKARAVAKNEKNAVVIGADTIAYRERKIFRKTDDARKARRILLELSGKTHYVVTGVAILFPDGKSVKYSVKALVKMKKLSERQLASYLKSGEWKGRAGCYDVSGRGRKLVGEVKGEKETVVGLPLKKLRTVLNIHCA